MHLLAILFSVCACALVLCYLRKPKPVPPPCARPPLPVELQLLILQLGVASLAHPDDHKARTLFLISYVRVSRGVTDEAQRHFWPTLRFSTVAEFERAMCALVGRPERQVLVTHVDIRLAKRAKADEALEALSRMCRNVQVLEVQGVEGFRLLRLDRFEQLERLHFGDCTVADAYDLALDDLRLPRVTHLTAWRCFGFTEFFLHACPALDVLALETSWFGQRLSPVLATRLRALAAPDPAPYLTAQLPHLPACVVAMRHQGWSSGAPVPWFVEACPELRAAVELGVGGSAAEVGDALEGLEEVHAGVGRGWWGRGRQAKEAAEWAKRAVEWKAVARRECVHGCCLTRRAVEYFVAVADRVIAQEAEGGTAERH